MIDFEKLNNEKKEQGSADVWTDGTLDEIQYVKFEQSKNNSVHVKFVDDNPIARKNKFNQASFDFEVQDMDNKEMKCLSVTSKRLMRVLKTYLPLSGKELCIQRTGTEMETDYNVTLVSE